MKIPVCMLCLSSLLLIACAGATTEIFRFSELAGIEVTHTEFGRSYREGKGFMTLQDKIAGEILITLEETKPGSEECYIIHNGGKQPVTAIRGKDSVTFVESYGGNIYLWTVCLEEKNKDGTRLMIMAANLTEGAIGIRTKVFRGKATIVNP